MVCRYPTMTRGTSPRATACRPESSVHAAKRPLTETRCLKQLFRLVLGRLAADLIQADGSAACQYAQH